MKKIFIILFFLITVTVFGVESNLSFFSGISFPTSSFGGKSSYNETNGFANLGYLFTTEYDINLNYSNYFGSASVSLIMNPFDNEHTLKFYNQWLEIYSTDDTYDLDVVKKNWIQFPLFAGIKYQKDFFKMVKMFWEVQAGINFCKYPDQKIKFYNFEWADDHFYENKTEITRTTKIASNLASRLSFGVIYREKYVLKIAMYNLGVPDIQARYKLEQNYYVDEAYHSSNFSDEEFEYDQIPIRIVAVNLGIRFDVEKSISKLRKLGNF